jgi:hypothetical protein
MKKKTTYQPGKRPQPVVLKETATAPVVAPAVSGPAAMLRTQIYLTREEYHFLQTEGARRGAPMAAVIRSFIDEKMVPPDEVWENNSLLAPPADPRFMGPEDGPINHDHYLHGCPKKWIKREGRWVEAPPLPEDYYSNRPSADAYDRMLKEMDECQGAA